ncbi:Sodium/calcium exchanger protein-domain-containing protein, partial [Sporodiniella umbellata]
CTDIESQLNQCDFVQSACHGPTGVYLKLYYCLSVWKKIMALFLLLFLLMLFGAISIVASDFFCPNLQTISSKLELSESIVSFAMESGAGSLAIGELIGAAFFIVAIVSGCMGIIQPFQSQRVTFMRDANYLLGATIIMAWIVYKQQIHWYHGVILIAYHLSYVCLVVFSAYTSHGNDERSSDEQKAVHEINVADETTCLLPEEPIIKSNKYEKPPKLQIPTKRLSSYPNISESHIQYLGYNSRTVSSVGTSPISPILVSQFAGNLPRTSSSHSTKTYRRSISPKIGFRTSLFGAIEFQEQVSIMKRALSSQMLTIPEIRLAPPTNYRQSMEELECQKTSSYVPRQSARDSIYLSCEQLSEGETFFTSSQNCNDIISPTTPLFSQHSGAFLTANQTSFSLRHCGAMQKEDSLLNILFPTLQGFREKSTFSKVNAVIAAPLVLVFTLTLPVVELEDNTIDIVLSDETNDAQQNSPVLAVGSYLSIPYLENETKPTITTDKTKVKLKWDRQLLSIQSVFSLVFTSSLAVVNDAIRPSWIYLAICIGIAFSLFVLKFTKTNEAPSWFWMTSFVGLFVALNWIFLLANQVVALLQAIGKVFLISDSIMGITVFAFGNSAGDLVANTAIAKLGFPTMAISACYAGPLLNMVLGVGISSTYQIWKSGKPYKLNIASSILVALTGLVVVLVSTIIAVNMNGYRITRHLGVWMISVYLCCIVISLLLEFKLIGY